jgi:hypothetical protein
MRDESIVVAAELTGKLGHQCFFCGSRHIAKNTVQRCARNFVRDVFGCQVIGSSIALPDLNWVAMAKLGLTEEAELYNNLKASASSHSSWEPNWQDFVMCENVDEAYAIAKAKLAVWRDEAFAKYSEAARARVRCQTEFDHLIKPDKAACMKNPKKINVEKELTNGLTLKVEGVFVHAWNALSFYRLCWPEGSIPGGTVVDVDLNRNVLVQESVFYTASQTGSRTYSAVHFHPDGTVTSKKLAKQKPVEDC